MHPSIVLHSSCPMASPPHVAPSIYCTPLYLITPPLPPLPSYYTLCPITPSHPIASLTSCPPDCTFTPSHLIVPPCVSLTPLHFPLSRHTPTMSSPSLSHHTPSCPIALPHPIVIRVPLKTLITPPTSLHPPFFCAITALLCPVAPPVHHPPPLPTATPLSQHIPHFSSHSFYPLPYTALSPPHPVTSSCPSSRHGGPSPIPAPCTPHLLGVSLGTVTAVPTPPARRAPARPENTGRRNHLQTSADHNTPQETGTEGLGAPPALGCGVLEPLREEGILLCHPWVGFAAFCGTKPSICSAEVQR